MSTKIYDAWIMTDIPSLFELRQRMAKLRRKIQLILYKAFLKRVGEETTTFIDDAALKQMYHGRILWDALSSAVNTVEDANRKIEKTGERDPENDFSFNIEIIALKDKVLVMPFGENRECMGLLNRQSWLKEYGYWNNTDPDENCTAKEWNQRERDWNKALPDVGVPAYNGFSVQLSQTYPSSHPTRGFHPTIEEVLPYITPYERRVKFRARRLAVNKAMYRRGQKRIAINRVVSVFLKAEETVSKNPKLLETQKKWVEQKLVKEITAEIIKAPAPEYMKQFQAKKDRKRKRLRKENIED